jgi:hypothetical protein
MVTRAPSVIDDAGSSLDSIAMGLKHGDDGLARGHGVIGQRLAADPARHKFVAIRHTEHHVAVAFPVVVVEACERPRPGSLF